MKRLDTYSQHFLRGQDFIKELIGHTSIKPSDLVYDIGAGTGAITAALAQKAKFVVAIEVEPLAAEKLRENIEGKYPNVDVIEADFLDIELPVKPYKIFSNIPFHLTSPIIHKITEDPHPPVDAYLIVQRQVANKLLPNYDGFTGQLGMIIGPTFGVRIRRPLKRSDYTPPPAVDTVLIEIKRRDEPFIPLDDMPKYRKFIEGCFSDPKIFTKTPRAKVGLREGIKPSEMKLHQWVELFKAYKF